MGKKYRPVTLSEVVGQTPIIDTVDLMIRHRKVPHCLEFYGPRGCGKTTVARIIATGMGCRDMDLIEIDGASHGHARRIIESAAYLPHTKTFIIDEAHMLAEQAFNALLKTLEEPPPNVLFILCTTEPRKIPLTVRSRCTSFEFKLIDVGIITIELKRIMSAEEIIWTDGDAEKIAEMSGGSIRLEVSDD